MNLENKKRHRIITFLVIITIIVGLLFISYPFIQIYLDKRTISENLNKWDKERVIVYNDKLENNKSNKSLNNKLKDNKSENIKDNQKKFPEVRIKGKSIIGKIIFPKTGDKIPILKGATEENLKGGATLYDNGIYPGDYGTSVILGHRETTFGFLENIHIGDKVNIESLNEIYEFKVKKIYITNPEDKSILEQENKSSITLVTCYPFRYIGSAPERFIVKLDLIS
ncbi:class D sortase [Clostridium sporogenes]|uniref:class D sortase n=1 Tax=Clostridium sporogenes TaxID=1509 RepID=UPI0013D75015|nr:class D sortase [Clostridium sporogenes]NFG95188.1 class D sortase [Clostridium sporogenes]NFH32871.1 class D sortase [Clostridium sporogenes]NFL19771.1 class D sortase [Clostridium sporogenes]NFL74923.1 class D sortase [Clostridium sporogenes]NFN73255.1 class D sortase [Clostridium sporogenes]